nr:hypothetical protein [Tanacetum cinerariifolium]
MNHGKFIHMTNEALAASQELAMEAASQELAMEAGHAQTIPFHIVATLIFQHVPNLAKYHGLVRTVCF